MFYIGKGNFAAFVNFLLAKHILNDILTLPIYMLKLKQEASSKISSRDFGSYKSSSKQPQQGRSKNGVIANGSRLGQMEFDALLAHNVDRAIRELRTVKNESKTLNKEKSYNKM